MWGRKWHIWHSEWLYTDLSVGACCAQSWACWHSMNQECFCELFSSCFRLGNNYSWNYQSQKRALASWVRERTASTHLHTRRRFNGGWWRMNWRGTLDNQTPELFLLLTLRRKPPSGGPMWACFTVFPLLDPDLELRNIKLLKYRCISQVMAPLPSAKCIF